MIVEPIQGRGGIIVPPDDFLMKLRHFCDHHGLVLIFDEIYTGFCRTGRWFACEHWDVIPDLICVGKGMTGGFPMAACIGRAKVMDSWPESRGEAIHTSTFLGNPLGCAASLAAIAEMKRLKLDRRAAELGEHLSRVLGGPRSVVATSGKRTRQSASLQLRGKGLMLGLEVSDAPRLCEQLLQQGIIAIPEGERGEVLGITPPLVITKRQLDYSMKVLTKLSQTVLTVRRLASSAPPLPDMRISPKSLVLVGAQLVCLAYLLVSGPWLASIGWVWLEIIGLYLGAWAIYTMKLRNLRIAPEVARGARLVTTGPYRFIRHPMYSAVLLITVSLVLSRFTIARLTI